MNGRDFYDCVVKHDKLEWLGVIEGATPATDEALICHTKSGVKHAVTVAAILDTDWGVLESIFTGERYAKNMIHITRIVGYYSRVTNWNGSKLAELKDRHAGDYTLDAQPKKKKVMVPGVVGRQSVGAKGGSRTRTPEGIGI